MFELGVVIPSGHVLFVAKHFLRQSPVAVARLIAYNWQCVGNISVIGRIILATLLSKWQTLPVTAFYPVVGAALVPASYIIRTLSHSTQPPDT